MATGVTSPVAFMIQQAVKDKSPLSSRRLIRLRDMRLYSLLSSLLLATFVAVSCSGKDEPTIDFPDDPNPDNPPTGQYLSGIIFNQNFEDDINLTKNSDVPEDGKWYYVGGWRESGAKVSQIDGYGYKDSRCLCIAALDHTVDVAVVQRIKVVPGKNYKVSVKIKTSGVSGANPESGACISLNSAWSLKSKRVYGTTDWTTVSLELEPETDYLEIALRLGANSDDARGVAYFDNVSISYNNDLYVQESEHLVLMCDKKYISISESMIGEWLSKLDKVYEAYVELFSGRKPYGGNKIRIRSGSINAWAYAGNPIQWNENYITETLMSVKKGDWCFGLMHELGHDFAPGHFTEFSATCAFDFNEEVMANWRMYYALEKLDGVVFNKDKIYHGKEVVALYRSDTPNSYDNIIRAGRCEEMGNGLTYCLWRIRDAYGWQVWIDTWDEIYRTRINSVMESSMNQWQKFDYLLTILSKHTPDGQDVRETFPDGELDLIKKYLSTQK